MKRRHLFGLATALWLGAFVASHAAEGPPLRVFLDVSYAPDGGGFALKTSPLLLEWYPRINAILYGPDHALPFDTLFVTFQHGLNYPAYATGNVIHISADVLNNRQDSYEGMVVHELTHLVQHYPNGQTDAGWLIEGIADYVRHKAYERDIAPTMNINAQGHAYGYTDKEPYFHSIETQGVNLTQKGYLQSYTVASSFLFWLETRKDKQIIHRLNQALSEGRYDPALFYKFCGQGLDDLWAGFVAESQGKKH